MLPFRLVVLVVWVQWPGEAEMLVPELWDCFELAGRD